MIFASFLVTIYILTMVNTLIFHDKNDDFSIKNDVFYMMCSTFLQHLYTENKENYDFALKKKHEFGMKNELFLQVFW